MNFTDHQTAGLAKDDYIIVPAFLGSDLKNKGDKLSIFFTYAKPNAQTDEHIGVIVDEHRA
ncbi:hypothetical protein SAMN05518801_11027 [Novosphingobium sp. CF614]|uniref:hypothetical protein n=1 Tax=Novosphingobium sp. CF614 TaxID=1884364 RepID=UPI0008E3749F|nr:hypothetical protein [Novosphingobium sp. CF614]SFG19955.1 hypothetical protein SAMN05518801_11027 [Novosphingobium sp. CF614]